MVSIKFFPLDITYKVINGKALIYLFGRSLEGTQICVVDDFEPYFYVIPKQLDVKQKLKSIKLGRNWFTTKEWLDEYIASTIQYKSELQKAASVQSLPKDSGESKQESEKSSGARDSVLLAKIRDNLAQLKKEFSQ